MYKRKPAILIIVLVLFLVCSCAKKKVEQVFTTPGSSPSQYNSSDVSAYSPEVAPSPIDITSAYASSGDENELITRDMKQFEDDDIYFNFDQHAITPEGKKLLVSKAAFLRAHPAYNVRIEGHCDERGTTEYNLALGEKRADEVKRFLVSLGIIESRLTVISYGKEKPIDPGHNETAWGKNRRAHLDILK